LTTALAIGRPGAGAFALAAAGVAAFLAHEPLLVLIGHRGARVARAERGRAWAWLGATGAVALGSGGVALANIGPPARVALALPVGCAVVAAMALAARREHTAAGEIVAAVALASLALPAALASGASWTAAWTCALVFAASFVVATVSVRAVVLVARRAAGPGARVAACACAACAVAVLAVLASAAIVASIAPWAAAPVCGTGFVLAAAAPSPRRLRAIGWVLVLSIVFTAAALAAGLR
jgi:YwiC-like protein